MQFKLIESGKKKMALHDETNFVFKRRPIKYIYILTHTHFFSCQTSYRFRREVKFYAYLDRPVFK